MKNKKLQVFVVALFMLTAFLIPSMNSRWFAPLQALTATPQLYNPNVFPEMMVGCNQSGSDYAVLGYRNTGNLSMPGWEEVDAWGIHNVTGNRARASPCFGDLDGDGLLDMLVSNAINVPGMGYKNVGNNTNPVWQRCSAWDVPSLGGYEQNPALADVDGDGLLDLCVGNMLPPPHSLLL
jgi:hypothetical protein